MLINVEYLVWLLSTAMTLVIVMGSEGLLEWWLMIIVEVFSFITGWVVHF